ncbi:hypothetical protein L6232_20390, partial [Shewanella sp. C31]|nr:hypothetical protein [Shewanella electrica]
MVAEEAQKRFGLPLFLAGGSLGAFVVHLLLAGGFPGLPVYGRGLPVARWAARTASRVPLHTGM